MTTNINSNQCLGRHWNQSYLVNVCDSPDRGSMLKHVRFCCQRLRRPCCDRKGKLTVYKRVPWSFIVI